MSLLYLCRAGAESAKPILRVSESRDELVQSLPNRRTQQEQSYAGINYALQGGGRQSQLGVESAKPMVKA